MPRKILAVVLWIIVPPLTWAAGDAIPVPLASPVPTLSKAAPPPSPVPPLLSVPAGLKPAEITVPYSKKKSPWLSMTGVGIGIPLSPRLASAYTNAFNLNLGTGIRLSTQWTFWLDLSLALYGSKNDPLTGGNNLNLINAALWARYRLLDSDLSPYLFGGPGLAYNENRSNNTEIYDPSTGNGSVPINAYEVDLLAEGGAGLDLKIGEGASVFLQARVAYDFTSGHFAGFAYTDSPIKVMPIEIGMIFGI